MRRLLRSCLVAGVLAAPAAPHVLADDYSDQADAEHDMDT